MGHNTEKHLQDIIQRLEEQGIDVGQLNHLSSELQQSHRPWYTKLKDKAAVQWSHIAGEFQDSKRLSTLLLKRAQLTPTEKDEVRSQLGDIFRMVPAGLIAAANAALPIPGTSMLTPLLLQKAGLLPSRWREAHMLETLQSEYARIKELGDRQSANAIQALHEEICAEADARKSLCDLLRLWDENQNGIWDPDEIEEYNSEVSRVHQHLHDSRKLRQWYILQAGFVFGPTALPAHFEDASAMISFGGKTRWVRLFDAIHHRQFSVDEPPELPAAHPQAESGTEATD